MRSDNCSYSKKSRILGTLLALIGVILPITSAEPARFKNHFMKKQKKQKKNGRGIDLKARRHRATMKPNYPVERGSRMEQKIVAPYCPPPPADAKLLPNATRLLFIGPHHTGTTAYVGMASNSRRRLLLFDKFKSSSHSNFSSINSMFHHVQLTPWSRGKSLMKYSDSVPIFPAHDNKWTAGYGSLWMYDALADTPYQHVWEWNELLEFGHPRHPDVRMLVECFPRSLFVINTRSLVNYVRSKVNWETGRHGYSSEPCGGPRYPPAIKKNNRWYNTSARYNTSAISSHPNLTNPGFNKLASSMCSIAVVRELLFERFLNFIAEDPASRQRRFLATDVTTEDYGRVAYRLCRFFSAGSDAKRNTNDLSFHRRCKLLLGLKPNGRHNSFTPNKKCENELVQSALQMGKSNEPGGPSRILDEIYQSTSKSELKLKRKLLKENICALLPPLDLKSLDSPGLAFPGSASQAHAGLFEELFQRYGH